MSSGDVIAVGKLGRPRGLKGEIFVTLGTDFPDRFIGMKEILVKGKDGWEKYSITASRIIGKRPVLKFKGINSPEDAARLTNRKLGVFRDNMVELEEGTFFVFDLIGCEVLDEKSNQRIGKVVEVEQNPAHDIYHVRIDNGDKILVPAVKQFVRNVDLEKKHIIVDLTGLVDQ